MNNPLFKLSLFLVCMSPFMAGSSIASPEKNLWELPFEDLLELKVKSATKFIENTETAPAIITIHSREEFEAFGVEVVNDLLYMLPGFGYGQDYDRPTVNFRGNIDSWSNNHILHLIDGIPFNDNLYGSAYTWMQPVFFSKNIEVIRGPGSPLYGSNATNGVVQMNTLDASDLDNKTHIRFTAPLTNGRQQVQFMTGKEKGDIDFIIAFHNESNRFEDYTSFDGSGRLETQSAPSTNRPLAARFNVNNASKNDYLFTKLSIGDAWKIQYHHQSWEFETGHGWLFWVPDLSESMNENRNLVSVNYTQQDENRTIEVAARYQRHELHWNQRYYPNGAFNNFYPAGMWEYIDSSAEDLFLRLQVAYQLEDNASFLAGLENDVFLYSGDEEHYSNVDIDADTLEPFPNNSFQRLGPWLDYLLDRPVTNSALFVQYDSGKAWSSSIDFTLGFRWDFFEVNYRDINTAPIRKENKRFDQLSPRFASVWSLTPDSTIKFLWNKAFRAPTATELGGAHTFSLASNIEELRPETLESFELGGEVKLNKSTRWRWNSFVTRFSDQIAYSTVNFNLSTNIVSTKNAGLESELMGEHNNLRWFANLSYVERLDEQVLVFDELGQAEFTEHTDVLKWSPKLQLKAGMTYKPNKPWLIALTYHYQGEVQRRENELGNPGGSLPLGVSVPNNFSLDDHRPRIIPSWHNIDLRIDYLINAQLHLQLEASNLFDERRTLIKTGPFPFDYQLQGRQVTATLAIEL